MDEERTRLPRLKRMLICRTMKSSPLIFSYPTIYIGENVYLQYLYGIVV